MDSSPLSSHARATPRGARITALGCYTPPRLLTNPELERLVDTTNEWILTRTGIHQRHIAGPGDATSDLAVEAARAALAARGMEPSGLDAIIVCTVTPDMFFPSTACLVQDRLGAKGCWGFDLVAACSGFLYGLTTAAHLVSAGTHNRVMVIGADTMSRIIDYQDRATCVLFGDGAGAMLLEPGDGGGTGLIDFLNEIDGSGAPFLNMPAGGSRMPASAETVEKRLHFVHQDGQQVFKFAVRKMYEVCRDLLARNNLKASDVRLLIPHQANLRIITATADRLGFAAEQVVINIGEYGNTTSATLPLATRDAVNSGKLRNGDLVLFAAVGAGYT
ncbi:MAG TPA: beta-ketoacyl-ACP synthase III, partial [Bryobacteraceae bacterium]|nr:beta-ketoacyl-ACP synthase III [Bryobacteraceae bacterium]